MKLEVVLLACAAAACSAPATLADLSTAESRERAGDVDGALVAYRAAQESCQRVRPERRRRLACAQALLGEANLLEAAGREADARAAFLAVPEKAAGDPIPSAQALYRVGVLALRAGDDVGAWTAWWRVVTEYPDEPFASDAIQELVADGRGRDASALFEEMARLYSPLADSEVGDNLLWAMADLAAVELGDLRTGMSTYDRIPVDHPESGLRDDARWRSAALARQLGDGAGAATRLQGLLATREVAFGAGSYFSIWLDDAQLELGRVQRDLLHDDAAAEATFGALPELYPASILRDDALWELARTRSMRGDVTGGCAALAQLRSELPDSRFVDEPLPTPTGKHACPAKKGSP